MIDNGSAAFTGDKLQNYFTAYVERALRNNRVSYYRKQRNLINNEVRFGSEDELAVLAGSKPYFANPDSNTGQLSPETVQHDGLANELRNISEKDMSIIRMRIGFGFTYKRIAAILGMKEEAVRVRYFRALQKIRTNMEGGTK